MLCNGATCYSPDNCTASDTADALEVVDPLDSTQTRMVACAASCFNKEAIIDVSNSGEDITEREAVCKFPFAPSFCALSALQCFLCTRIGTRLLCGVQRWRSSDSTIFESNLMFVMFSKQINIEKDFF